MNALKYHWYELSLLPIASCFEEFGVQRFYLQEVCARTGPVLYSAKNAYQNFFVSYTYIYITFKRNLQHVSHKWIICGSHPDCSVGQMGQQVRVVQPTFDPDPSTMTT